MVFNFISLSKIALELQDSNNKDFSQVLVQGYAAYSLYRSSRQRCSIEMGVARVVL